MNKQLIRLFLILVIGNTAFAEISNYSYRMNGLGKELLDFTNDEYSDIYYNPYYINKIEGIRIFSNLSNLNGAMPTNFAETDINLLRNTLYPTNLIGGIGNWKGNKVGVIYSSSGFAIKLRNEHTSSSVYNGLNLNTGSGDFETKGVLGGRDINLFYGNQNYSFLLKFSTFSSGIMSTDNDESVEYTATGQTESKWTEKDEYGMMNNTYVMGISAGKVEKLEQSEISKSVGIEPAFLNVSIKDVSNYLNQYFELNDINGYKNDYNNSESISVSGWSAFGRYREQSFLNETITFSRVLKLSANWVPFSWTSKNYELYENWDTGWGDEFFRHTYNESKQKNEISGNAFIISTTGGYGFELNFPESITKLILGAKVKYFFVYFNGNDAPDVTENTYYRVYPNASNDDDDYGYESTLNNNKSIELAGQSHIISLNFPIGVETKLSKKLNLRLGANTLLPLFGHGNIKYSEEDEPNSNYTRITHGPDKGEINQQTNDSPTYKSSDKFSITSSNANLSSYNFGLGWEINQNLHLDILHFSKLTDLGTWWFSLGIKF